MRNLQSTAKILKKGFTLIELLMVIAIIGIITSIVLSSLNSSRDKAYESQIKQQLVSFRSAAEIYFYSQTPPSYGVTSDCTVGVFGSVNTNEGRPGLTIDLSSLPPGVSRECSSTDRAYAVKVSSYTDNGYWCADSKGTVKYFAGAIGSPVTQCP
jgi:prepilin-type N-terminal cleavage/methylation domain-containing protein